ncbi:MAG: polyamine aminopropyltransferase [Gammaproteobacteria bacterium]|nr:polyamine aminopropyltransferase [Gammaproteobacteria bacterium]
MTAVINSENWFTEFCDESGSAFSLCTTRKLYDSRSRYQRIQVFETTHFGNLLVLDGFVMLSARENFIYHEMMTHPALCTHARPRNILIVGGGDCGCLREVLKHETVEQVDQVELDQEVTHVSEKFFPELCAANNDPRANLHFTDAINWVEDAPSKTYDIIIVDSTDPVGQAARLFAAPFYRACRRALRNDGMLVAQSESPLIHLELILSIRAQMSAAGFTSLDTLNFPQCTYPSGWWSATLASTRGAHDQIRTAVDVADCLYYNAEVHRAALTPPVFLHNAMAAQRATDQA